MLINLFSTWAVAPTA